MPNFEPPPLYFAPFVLPLHTIYNRVRARHAHMRLIRKLDAFILKSYLLLFAGTFFICLFIFMMQFMWRYVEELIGKGLSLEVMAQFFLYMGLMLVPQALPLAILLSSLITFGNLGESSELTAIKSAGVSLMQSFRSLIFITILITLGSFYFQNVIGPNANKELATLMLSMKQKNPELEIPEGIFYDGIPNTNLYVQKKDMETGMLYGIMIYRMTQSYEDAAIILADSGMLQSTAERKHLALTLWSGEWFENMRSQELAGSASVPYRRETFALKKILLDFDADFNMADGSMMGNDPRAKSLKQIFEDMDSMNFVYDSIGRAIYNETKQTYYRRAHLQKKDSLKALMTARAKTFNVDSVFEKLSANDKQHAISNAMGDVDRATGDYEFRRMFTEDGDYVDSETMTLSEAAYLVS